MGKGCSSSQVATRWKLTKLIAQSLAGRTALLSLLPLSLSELSKAHIKLSLDQLLLKGGYPRIHKDELDPTKAHRNYFQTYIERDLRQLIQIKDLTQFKDLCGPVLAGSAKSRALLHQQ